MKTFPGYSAYIVLEVSGITIVVFNSSRFCLFAYAIITGRLYPGSLPYGTPKSII